jgi:hypothetical protein
MKYRFLTIREKIEEGDEYLRTDEGGLPEEWVVIDKTLAEQINKLYSGRKCHTGCVDIRRKVRS